MADPVAIVSVVTSGVLTPSIVAWYALSRQREEHRDARLNELRDVLDGAAEALGAARRSGEAVHTLWYEGVSPESEEARSVIQARSEAVEKVRYAQDRIAIRVGTEADVYKRFDEALSALDGLSRVLLQYRAGAPYDEATTELSDAHQLVNRARLEYLSSARAEVGAPRRSS